uniref:Transcription initiation factor TFIID subunit 9 n=1 Tax=Compsopogon caeruleus TaxID=31354 RepID=A0A7S1T9Q4_9RHOD|mmetsp:Transcript_13843/g.28379  ORF Transcript_13843/g.28379 Transcript_13843/m.28379 type:complete len:150 (+) Transcript_13843:153-602(+)
MEKSQSSSDMDGREGPRDAFVLARLLRGMGVESYDDRVIHQLLELVHRYVTNVLDEARTYSDHAGKSEIDLDDVKLAIQSCVRVSFTSPPSREVLLQLARERNAIPLPDIEARGEGIQLPPEKFQLTKQAYRVRVKRTAAESQDTGQLQ